MDHRRAGRGHERLRLRAQLDPARRALSRKEQQRWKRLGAIFDRTHLSRPAPRTDATPPSPGVEPAPFLAEGVVCHACGDAGQVRLPYDAAKDERPRYAPCAACPRPTLDAFGTRAGIPAIYRRKTLADFDGTANARAKQIMTAYVARWGSTGPGAPPPFAFLVGQVKGTGKTSPSVHHHDGAVPLA